MSNFEEDERRWSEWMVLAQQGDEQHYAKLLTEVADAAAAFLYKRFGLLDFVEDCVQECLMTIHAARHTYDHRRAFRPWLFAIVRNRAIDMLRSQQAYQKTLDKNALFQENLQTVLIEEEINKGMVFSRLSPAHRDVLLLNKIFGFSAAETAKKLGISEASVRIRVHRGIKETRKHLQFEQ